MKDELFAALMIALWVAIFTATISLVTSFIMWDWQWFWDSNEGWRVLVVMILGGFGASR